MKWLFTVLVLSSSLFAGKDSNMDINAIEAELCICSLAIEIAEILAENQDYPREVQLKLVYKRVLEALKMVDLEGVEKKMPSDLSGGMKKRAALARLIVYRPQILLYDEPTTGLDPITAHQINELIVKTQNELQGTSIIVTHDIHSALCIADRLALHQDGKILYIEEPKEFIKIDDPVIAYFRDTINNHPRIRDVR